MKVQEAIGLPHVVVRYRTWSVSDEKALGPGSRSARILVILLGRLS